MPDISMCANDADCDRKTICYRSAASGTKPKIGQAWADFEPEHEADHDCVGFIQAPAKWRERRGITTELIDSLGDALPREMVRVRDEIIPPYQSIGPNGNLAVMMMRRDLDAAVKALAEGDVAAMIRAYTSLKEYKL